MTPTPRNPTRHACGRKHAPTAQVNTAAAQVLDFNLAKSVHQPQGWVADTPCGTSPYIAPEVLSHQRYSQVQLCAQILQLLLLLLLFPGTGKSMQVLATIASLCMSAAAAAAAKSGLGQIMCGPRTGIGMGHGQLRGLSQLSCSGANKFRASEPGTVLSWLCSGWKSHACPHAFVSTSERPVPTDKAVHLPGKQQAAVCSSFGH